MVRDDLNSKALFVVFVVGGYVGLEFDKNKKKIKKILKTS